MREYGKRIDRTGEKHGRLLLLRRNEDVPSKWDCSCDCGKQLTVSWRNIRAGRTKSCGCLRDERKAVQASTASRTLAADERGTPRCDCVGPRIRNSRLCKSCQGRWSKYGLSPDEFEFLFETQASECAICQCAISRGPLAHVDHCHETNDIRGILCVRCNIGLGQMRHSVEILERAIRYLQRPRTSHRSSKPLPT